METLPRKQTEKKRGAARLADKRGAGCFPLPSLFVN